MVRTLSLVSATLVLLTATAMSQSVPPTGSLPDKSVGSLERIERTLGANAYAIA